MLNYRNLTYQYLNTFTAIAYPLIIFPYITTILTPANYGTLSFYDSVYQMIVVFAAFGVPYYGIRELGRSGEDPEKKMQLIGNLFLLNMVISVLGMIAFLALMYFSDLPFTHPVLTSIYCATIFLSIFSLDWLFQGEERFLFLFLRNLAIRALYVLLVFVLVKGPQDLIRFVALTALSQLLIAVSSVFSVWPYFGHWSNFRLAILRLIPVLLVFAVIGFLATFYMNIGPVILGYFRSQEEIGYFAVANKISRIAITVLVSSGVVFYARLSKDMSNRHRVEYSNSSFLYTLHLSFLAFLWVLFFSEDIIVLLNGMAYTPAIPSLQILSTLLLIVPLHDFLTFQILFQHRREKKFLQAIGVVSLISLALHFPLISWYGVQGASIAILSTEIMLLVTCLILTRHLFPIQRYFGQATASLFIALIVVIASHLVVKSMVESALEAVLWGLFVTVGIYFVIQLLVIRNPLFVGLIRSFK